MTTWHILALGIDLTLVVLILLNVMTARRVARMETAQDTEITQLHLELQAVRAGQELLRLRLNRLKVDAFGTPYPSNDPEHGSGIRLPWDVGHANITPT